MAIISTEIDRINNTILKFSLKRIFFLGDLFHSDLNHEWNIFSKFLLHHPTIEFILIKGNHNILNDQIYKLSQLKIEKEPFQFSTFILSHHPLKQVEVKNGEVNLYGHIHPGISIKGKGRSYLSMPCFLSGRKTIDFICIR